MKEREIELKRFVVSDVYPIFQKMINEKLTFKLNEMVHCRDNDQLLRLQGQAQALKELTELKERINVSS